MQIPLSQMSITNLERSYVVDAIESTWVSASGRFLDISAELLGNRIGLRHVFFTNSGTSALELALTAIGVGPGDEVIVPAFSFSAPASAVANVGGTPVVCDVTGTNWTLDPVSASKLMTERTVAIIAVDVLGHPCDYGELKRLNVPIIQDSAEAHNAKYESEMCGRQGDITVFSFHANKTIASGEGGCVASADSDIMSTVRSVASHGMSAGGSYDILRPGRNVRMTNLTAAVLAGQLERWDELCSARQTVDRHYRDLLPSSVGRRPVAAWATDQCWLASAVAPAGARPRILDHLRNKRGVDARAIWPAINKQAPFRTREPVVCPIAEDLAQRVIMLPTWAGMTESEVLKVCEAFSEAL